MAKKPKVVIDLRTKIVRPGHTIWVLFPGSHHKFYRPINADKKVFLDLPALKFSKLPVSATTPHLLEGIAISQAVKSWHQNNRPDGKAPSRQIEQYAKARWTKTRSQFRGSLIGLFGEAKRGDLVLVPGPGYFTDVLVGEFTAGINEIDFTEFNRYPREKIPARNVEWLAYQQKHLFPSEIIDRLQNQNPFFRLDRSLRPYVLRLAYGTYVEVGSENEFEAKFTTDRANFSTFDGALLQRLISYLSNASEAIETGQVGGLQAKEFFNIPFAEAAFVAGDPSRIPDQTININSPGIVVLYNKAVVPIFVAAMLALATSAPLADSASISVENSGELPATSSGSQATDDSPTDPCVAKIDVQVRGSIDAMGHQRWLEVCEEAKRVQKQTGLKSEVKVRTVP